MKPETRRLFHKLHRWGGLLLAGAVFFYCLTGLLLNHRQAFDYFTVKESRTVAVPVTDTAVLEGFLATYKQQINRPDDPTVVRIRKDRTIEFLYGSHGKTTYVIRPGEGRMEIVDKHPLEPWSLLNDLHKAGKTGPVWLGLADAVALLLVGVTITGLLVIRYRRLDLLLLAGGMLLLVVGAWLA